jgi:hypothetical protein
MASCLLKDSSLWTLLSNEALPAFDNHLTKAALLENPHSVPSFAGYPSSSSCLTEAIDEVVASHAPSPSEEMWQSAAQQGQPEGVANKPSAPLPDVYAHGILGIGGKFQRKPLSTEEEVEGATEQAIEGAPPIPMPTVQAPQPESNGSSVFWSDLLQLGTELPSRNTAFSTESTGANTGLMDPANDSLDFLNTFQSSYHPNEATPSYLFEDFWSSGASMSFGSMLSGQNVDWSWLQTDQAFNT